MMAVEVAGERYLTAWLSVRQLVLGVGGGLLFFREVLEGGGDCTA